MGQDFAATRQNLGGSNLELRQGRPAGETSLREGKNVIAWLIRDDRLLISTRNSFFSGRPFGQNSKVKRAQLGVVSGWVTDREVAPGCA